MKRKAGYRKNGGTILADGQGATKQKRGHTRTSRRHRRAFRDLKASRR